MCIRDSLPADSEQFMLIEHLANQLDDLSTQIDEGRAPYDQQQKLTLEFYEKRINQLEEAHEKIRNDIMDMVHEMNGMKPSARHNGH